MDQRPERPLTLFYSYADEDKAYCEHLEKHLSILKRKGMITSWYDRKIEPGEDRVKAIDRHLDEAAIILLLVSPDFLASDYCYTTQMQRAIERQQHDEIQVILIIIRPVDWEEAPFAHLPCLPSDGTPVSTREHRDAAFADIARELRTVIEQKYAHLSEQKGPKRVFTIRKGRGFFSPQRVLVGAFLLLIMLLLQPLSPFVLPVQQPSVTVAQDTNLRISFLNEQSAAMVLASSLHAQRIDDKQAATPYHAIIQIRNLSTAYLFVDAVKLVIDKVTRPPQPLNVWSPYDPATYGNNYYRAVYLAQHPGSQLGTVAIASSAVTPAVMPPTTSQQHQFHVGLQPHEESDTLDLVVYSYQAVRLQFHLQVTYQVGQEEQAQSLALLYPFEVIFSDASNWHEYSLQGGSYVKNS